MNGASTILLFIRVGFSLAIVLGLIWLAARVAKRRGKIATRQAETTNIDVVARRQVGRRGQLVVVESAGRRLLVGVTENHIELVADLSSDTHLQAVDASSHITAAPVPPVVVSLPTVAARKSAVAESKPAVSMPAVEASAQPIELPPSDEPTGPRRESLVDALRDLTVRR